MENAGAPAQAASDWNQSGGSSPRGLKTGSIMAFIKPPSERNTHVHSTAIPTPAKTLGRYHAARNASTPRNLALRITAASRAKPCPKGTDNTIFSGALETGDIKPPVAPHLKNPKVHPLLSRQIMDCVQLDPNDRPASMEVIVNRLELIMDVLENPSEPAPEIVGDEDTRA